MERLDRDFYSVELDAQGNKVIHDYGYCYYSGDTQGDGKEYRHVEFCSCYITPGCTEGELLRATSDCKQYINNLNGKEVLAVMNDYCNTHTDLPILAVTQDTPCGDYLDC